MTILHSSLDIENIVLCLIGQCCLSLSLSLSLFICVHMFDNHRPLLCGYRALLYGHITLLCGHGTLFYGHGTLSMAHTIEQCFVAIQQCSMAIECGMADIEHCFMAKPSCAIGTEHCSLILAAVGRQQGGSYFCQTNMCRSSFNPPLPPTPIAAARGDDWTAWGLGHLDPPNSRHI